MLNNSSLSLCDIRVIDSLKKNPHAARAETQATIACQELNIKLDNFDDYNTMSSYLFPTADYNELLAIIMLNNLLFYIDDLHDRNVEGVMDNVTRRNMFEDIIEVFKTGLIKDSTSLMQAAGFGIRELFMPYADKRWLKRLIENTQKHFIATTYNVSDIQDIGRLTVDKYIELREHDSGMVPTVDLIEFANNFYMPQDLLDNEVIQKAISCTTRSAALMNDLFSYEKEVIDLDSDFNLIAIYMQSLGLSFEEAVHRSVEDVNADIDLFIELRDYLPDDEIAVSFYDALADQINAAWHWQYVGTNRYRSLRSPFPELRNLLKFDDVAI